MNPSKEKVVIQGQTGETTVKFPTIPRQYMTLDAEAYFWAKEALDSFTDEEHDALKHIASEYGDGGGLSEEQMVFSLRLMGALKRRGFVLTWEPVQGKPWATEPRWHKPPLQ